DPAEIGAQHIVSNNGSEAVRDNDDAIVVAPFVQRIEHVDRLPPDLAADGDIARRGAEVPRGVAEKRLKKQRIEDEIDQYDGKRDNGAVTLIQAPQNPAVVPDAGKQGSLRIDEVSRL